jgi:F0F1-type ATP synthase epsilon subunit
MPSTDKQQLLSVIARAPFHIYFEGEALTVSAANSVGPFDILPGHADFFSILDPCNVTIDTGSDSEPMTFEITNGIVAVRNDEVMLFVNI